MVVSPPSELPQWILVDGQGWVGGGASKLVVGRELEQMWLLVGVVGWGKLEQGGWSFCLLQS